MKSNKSYLTLLLVLMIVLGSSLLFGQVSMTVNSLADDEYSYAWDDPDTPVDESRDGICWDEQGRCTLRAAIEESNNLSLPAHITFSVSGTIDLLYELFPEDGSIIQGSGNIELKGELAFTIGNNCTIGGIQFNNLYNGITVEGSHNIIGINNTFINGWTALIIEGDSNSVVESRFGIDKDKVLGPNGIGINIIGNHTIFMRNTVCGNLAGISIVEGKNNIISKNYIGTTAEGDTGLGNMQGIIVAGSGQNIIGGENATDANIISGNELEGVSITGVPPDDYSVANIVRNNIIGLDPTETYALPNDFGIAVTNGARLSFFGKNIIAGNSLAGIYIFGYDDETMAYGHFIEENNIGVNSVGDIFPNGNGITLWGNVKEITIGTNLSGNHLPNIIVGNEGDGIFLLGDGTYYPHEITMRKNFIYKNNSANLLVGQSCNNGVLPPYSLSYSNNTIAGIHDIPNSIIDIYKADINEFSPSAYQWLGSTMVGANGVFSYQISDPSIEAISVTATTGVGNTSGFGFLELITDVEDEEQFPTEFSLDQNYPNPFNPSTTIKFSIPNEEFVSLKVYNSLGEEVDDLIDETKSSGNYSVSFDASNLSSGVYIYKISSGSFVETKKMILMK